MQIQPRVEYLYNQYKHSFFVLFTQELRKEFGEIDSVEEEYLDVLQNIEGVIVGFYRQNPTLTDYQVDSAMESLGRTYQREKTGGAPVLPKNELAKGVYDAMKGICDWRLGKVDMVDEEGSPMTVPDPLTVDEIQLCLKRLRKSVATWNKQGGSQGYLQYISQFL